MLLRQVQRITRPEEAGDAGLQGSQELIAAAGVSRWFTAGMVALLNGQPWGVWYALLLPGVITFGVTLANDGKSFLYAVPSRSDVTIYRQPWHDGKLTGPTQVAVKLPFAFPLLAGGNAYDFASDLSTVAYARPSGQADLFLLSQK